MVRVAIVQEYIPAYRLPFFAALQERAASVNIHIIVAAGRTSGTQDRRGDSVSFDGLREVQQRERSMFGRRITTRNIRPVIDDADLVVLEQARRNLDAYRLLARRRRLLPTALWGHGRDYTQSARGIDRTLLNWLTRRADWFFAYTDGGGAFAASLGFPPDRITVVRNSIDTAGLRRDVDALTSNELSKFSSTHDLRGKTAAFVGGLDASKRIPFLIEAATRAHEQDDDFRLVVAGAGDYESVVKQKSESEPWISYMGPVKGRTKALVLKAADVIAMPGRVGLVAVDSFAAGRPLVTTTWPWHAPEFEYVVDGQNAAVAANSVEAYSSKLLEVLGDRASLESLQRAASLEASRYSIAQMADSFMGGLSSWANSSRLNRRGWR